MKQPNYLDRIGSEDRVIGVLDDGRGPVPAYAKEMCHHPNGNTVIGHNVADDGICTDCGKEFPEVVREPFQPGDIFCSEVAKHIASIKPDWESFGEFNQCVSVYPDGHGDKDSTFWFGTANFTWGANVYESVKAQEDGDSTASLNTFVSQEETSTQKVAEAIVHAVERYLASRKFLEAMAAFHKAASDLNEAWSGLSQDDRHGGQLIQYYPFKESFDEIPLAIAEWLGEVEADVDFGKNKKTRGPVD